MELNILAEKILGASMISEKACDIMFRMLDETFFYGEYKAIYKAMLKVKADKEEVNIGTVYKYYKDINILTALTDNIATTRLQDKICKQYGEMVAKQRIKEYLSNLTLNMDNTDLQTVVDKIGTITIPNFLKGTQDEIRDLDLKPYSGLKHMGSKHIPTGLPTIDYAINDLETGLVTLVGGRNNGGKTTFCNQVIANAIDKGYKVLIVNGEERQETIINKLYTSVIGRNDEHYDLIKVNKRFKKEPKDEIVSALKRWHENKLKIFTKTDSGLKTTEQLFALLKQEVKQTRTDLIVIDNLMSILTSISDNEKNGKQADFMQNCCDLAKEYNVHIILVLHPNKTYRKGEDMESEQLSGTSDLANKADNIITVIREYDEQAIQMGVNGRIQVVKNREFSDLPKVYVTFEESTGLLLEINEDGLKQYDFGWEKHLGKDIPWED
jgi:twinkle protein